MARGDGVDPFEGFGSRAVLGRASLPALKMSCLGSEALEVLVKNCVLGVEVVAPT